MRSFGPLLFVIPACAAWFACSTLKEAPDGTTPDDAAAPESSTGPDPQKLEAGAQRDAPPESSILKTGDPRWALWPIPADDPPDTSYAIANGPDGAIVTDKVTDLSWQDNVPGIKRVLSLATSYCDDLVYSGHADWRLPTRIEAMSIISFKPPPETNLKMAGPAFSNVPNVDCFWTASTGAIAADGQWKISTGSVSTTSSTAEKCGSRCVRGGATLGAPIPRLYEIIGASAVRDTTTNLFWERNPPTNNVTWEESDARCKALAIGGRVWRLPGVKELASIVDETKRTPASVGAFGDYSFSMTTLHPGWSIGFGIGDVGIHFSSTRSPSRCVSGP